ncbi:uncharacterized protein LOC111717526 [Eurytemora carolleeae]|uniref:uncharacterized protein LOC111717526 n=1 Tax=Eurytemora carolleeae TaxID=1294199 RepID=UPI000C75DF8E|nr:uncharacterized protein LOC111717526 [Eurytemora carolleeae]|eukprot:XP_023348793.1 uncharacterized protein LOC111717526 [Eurytemora affinis]
MRSYTVFISFCLVHLGPWYTVNSSILTDMERPVPVTQTVAQLGSTGFLSCDVLSSGSKDDIELILWFKDNATKPMYSVDVMSKPLKAASQWSDTSPLGIRSTFSSVEDKTGLIIDQVLPQDAGMYRCTVDYKNSPTKSHKIKFSVIVPPGRPSILNEAGQNILSHDVGPFEVGDSLEVTCVVQGVFPTALEILEKPTYVSEGRDREVTCRAVGGFPPPSIQWWIGTKQLDPTYQNSEYQGVATSKLLYKPIIEDDGRYLTCKIIVSGRLEKVLEDSWEIKVLCKEPKNGIVKIFSHSQVIMQGKGVELSANPEQGIIRSTQSLVLQGVNRNSSGEYSCQAINSEGFGVSRTLSLNIMYAPVCISNDDVPLMLSAEIDTPTVISCQVDAFPPTVNFRWFFNNSEIEEWIGTDSFHQAGLASSLQFVPKSSKDYGSLFCMSENAVGQMSKPCSFQILPTGRPSALTECQVTNKTLSSMKIECQEGFDGGLPANFLLQVFETENMELRFQATNKVPVFEVSHLDLGSDLKIYLYAENVKGMSEAVVLEEAMPGSGSHVVVTNPKLWKDAASNTEPGQDSPLTIIISVAAGGCVVCLSLLVAVLLCGRKRIRGFGGQPTDESELSGDLLGSTAYTQVGGGTDYDYGSNQEDSSRGYTTNPDLIPHQKYVYGGEYQHELPGRSNKRKITETPPSQLSLISTNLPPPSGYGEVISVQRVRNKPTETGSSGPGSVIKPYEICTLDRKQQNTSHPSYPLYHTCTRKKRVTILEQGKEESEV